MGFPSFGRSGIDKSKSTQNTTITDNSNLLAGGDNSFAQRVDAGGGTVNILDGGAVQGALEFAYQSLGLADRSVTRSQEAFEAGLAQSLSTSEAERTGGANRTLIMSGLALAAVVGLAAVLKR